MTNMEQKETLSTQLNEPSFSSPNQSLPSRCIAFVQQFPLWPSTLPPSGLKAETWQMSSSLIYRWEKVSAHGWLVYRLHEFLLWACGGELSTAWLLSKQKPGSVSLDVWLQGIWCQGIFVWQITYEPIRVTELIWRLLAATNPVILPGF